MPIKQHPFPGWHFPGGCVDFAYPEAKLIIEVDGRARRARLADRRRDAERDAEAARVGWLVLRVTEEGLREYEKFEVDRILTSAPGGDTLGMLLEALTTGDFKRWPRRVVRIVRLGFASRGFGVVFRLV